MMRVSRQRWNQPRLTLSTTYEDAGVSGATVTAAVQRLTDGQWLQTGLSSWGASFATPIGLDEVDAVNAPGLYTFDLSVAAGLDYASTRDGLFVVYSIAENLPMPAVLEHEHIVIDREVSGEVTGGALAAATDTTATLGSSWAAATAELYTGQMLTVLSGDGAGQTRHIVAYNADRVATVWPAWAAAVSSASIVAVHAGGNPAHAVWSGDIEAIMGSGAGLFLPPTDERMHAAGGLLMALIVASTQGYPGTEWTTNLLSSGTGTTTKFYYASAEGPSVAQSASWAGKDAVFIAAASGQRRLVKIVSIATDGAVHAVVSLPDGSALPAAPIAGDRLLVLQTGQSGLTASDLLSASMSPYETSGTLGNHLNRMLRLRQENMKSVYTAWSANGQPTAGYVLTYASRSDLLADVDPWPLAKARHDFTATYDVDLQLTAYQSTRTL